MIPTHLGDAFIERPDYLLAFILSTPAERPETDSFVKEFIARVRRLVRAGDLPRIFATEGTIFSAMLLHHLISERSPEFADSLIARARRFSDDAAYRHAYAADRPYSEMETHLFPLMRVVHDLDTAVFFRELDTSPKDLEAAQSKTDDALTFLENAGLVIDPRLLQNSFCSPALFHCSFRFGLLKASEFTKRSRSMRRCGARTFIVAVRQTSHLRKWNSDSRNRNCA